MRLRTSLIIDMLQASAIALQEPDTTQIIRPAYTQLQQFLAEHYAIDVNALETGTIIDAQREQLDTKIAESVADEELLARLGALMSSLEQATQNRPTLQSVGVLLEDIKARYLHIRDVIAAGTGVQVLHAQFEEGIEVEQVQTYDAQLPQASKEMLLPSRNISSTTGAQRTLPPAVVLSEVKAGGKINIGTVTQSLTQIFTGESQAMHTARQRDAMLHLVEDTWINGLLKPSLLEGTRLYLQLEDRPDLVENHRWDEIVQMPQPPPLIFDAKTDIVDVFRQSQQSLLIVGEPGSGKTTLLLIIAQAMLAAAHADAKHPIPVVLNLASWSSQRGALAAWILNELSEKYLVPIKIAQPWLANDNLMLLLDGLDEVNEAHRVDCVTAINQFRIEHLVPLVVCSRLAEYELLPIKLLLQKAVRVCSLSQQQIDEYLSAAELIDSKLGGLIHADPQFRDLLSSPLMLYVISMASEHLTTETLAADLSPADWKLRLLETYVAAMFQRRSGRHLYPPMQTVNWLHWLAKQMDAHQQMIFLLEQMQPTLLVNKRQQLQYHVGVRLVGILLFLTMCIGVGPLAGAVGVGSPALGLYAGFAVGVLLSFSMLTGSIAGFWLSDIWTILVTGGLVALIWGVISINLVEALIVGIVFGVPGSLAGLALTSRQELRTTERITWSQSRLAIGLTFGLLITLLVSIIVALQTGLMAGLSNGLAVGICLVPAFMFAMGLTKVEAVQPSILPNQGIYSSLRNTLRLFGLVALPGVLLAVGWGVLDRGSALKGLAYGLVVVLPIGLIVAMVSGGAVVIQHYVLRTVLVIHAAIPWRFQSFLDYAADRVFLHRIGGGYIFYHRSIMEYFANIKDTKQ